MLAGRPRLDKPARAPGKLAESRRAGSRQRPESLGRRARRTTRGADATPHASDRRSESEGRASPGGSPVVPCNSARRRGGFPGAAARSPGAARSEWRNEADGATRHRSRRRLAPRTTGMEPPKPRRDSALGRGGTRRASEPWRDPAHVSTRPVPGDRSGAGSDAETRPGWSPVAPTVQLGAPGRSLGTSWTDSQTKPMARRTRIEWRLAAAGVSRAEPMPSVGRPGVSGFEIALIPTICDPARRVSFSHLSKG